MKIIKFYTEQFSGSSSKVAYLKAIKWLAKYILSKDHLKDSYFKIESNKEEGTVMVELYAGMSDDELLKEFCHRCKEFHKSFFINQETNCNRCNTKAYRDQMKVKLETKKTFRKERLEYLLKK